MRNLRNNIHICVKNDLRPIFHNIKRDDFKQLKLTVICDTIYDIFLWLKIRGYLLHEIIYLPQYIL